MKVIIIEDEVKTARELRAMIEDVDEKILVIAILDSVKAAQTWFKVNQMPDLILSDIQLGDGLSFDIFREVQITVPVVFCTAYDEYAIRAFESNSIDYLLKPISEEMLERAVKKYDGLRNHFNGSSENNSYNITLTKTLTDLETVYRHSILVHFGEKIIPVKTVDIKYIYTSLGSAYISVSDQISYAMRYNIEQLESMLNPREFFRANRQFIISRSIIKNVEHYFGRRLIVKVTCDIPDKILISKNRSNDFLKWLEL